MKLLSQGYSYGLIGLQEPDGPDVFKKEHSCVFEKLKFKTQLTSIKTNANQEDRKKMEEFCLIRL